METSTITTKICSKCKVKKSISEFPKRKDRKCGVESWCKECRKVHDRKKYLKYKPIQKQKDKIRHRKIRNERPWLQHLKSAQQRCNNSNNISYHWYGNKGIKCFLTENNIKFLWCRDEAYLLKKPSIDRIDSNGHYELNNCRFIEMDKNKGIKKWKQI